MRVLIIALLAAISYAQTDMSMLVPCKARTPDKCNGNSVDGVCRMNYNEMPPRCEEGDPMDHEDICASLQEDACKSQQRCCWNMRENLMIGRCVPFEMDVEDCPSMLPRIFPSTGGGADTGTDSGTVDAGSNGGADTTATVDTGSSGSGSQNGAMSYPFMTPNPPLSQRTQTMMGCEVGGMQGPDVCNSLKAGNFLNPHICGWNVKEGGCEEIELGKGNLCKTVPDQATCNQQGDCCWDMKGYCGEFDYGDCLRPMPNMPNLPTVNVNGMSIVPNMEEHMEAQSEMAEAKAEMMGDHMEMQQEMGMGMGGMGMYENELEYDELFPVQDCATLQLCHGRMGMNPCVLNPQGKCVQMQMPTFGQAPALRKEHASQSSTPFNYGHLLMVLGGGLIVGLAVGMCFQGLRSKNSIAPVLLEDNYRNI